MHLLKSKTYVVNLLMLSLMVNVSYTQSSTVIQSPEGLEIVMSEELELPGIYRNAIFTDSLNNVYNTIAFFDELKIEKFNSNLDKVGDIFLSLSEDSFPKNSWSSSSKRIVKMFEFTDAICFSVEFKNSKNNTISEFVQFFSKENMEKLSGGWELLTQKPITSNIVRPIFGTLPDNDSNPLNLKSFVISNSNSIASLYEMEVDHKRERALAWFDSHGDIVYNGSIKLSEKDDLLIYNIFFLSDDKIGCFLINEKGENYCRIINADGSITNREMGSYTLFPMDIAQIDNTKFMISGINDSNKFTVYYFNMKDESVLVSKDILKDYYVSDLIFGKKNEIGMFCISLWDGGFEDGWRTNENISFACLAVNFSSDIPELNLVTHLSKTMCNQLILDKKLYLQKESSFFGSLDFNRDRLKFSYISYDNLFKRSEVPYGKFYYASEEYDDGISYRTFILDTKSNGQAVIKLDESKAKLDTKELLEEKMVTSSFFVQNETSKNFPKGTLAIKLRGGDYYFRTVKLIQHLYIDKKMKINKYRFNFIKEFKDDQGRFFIYFKAKHTVKGRIFKIQVY